MGESSCSGGGTGRLSRELRGHLQNMTAALQALEQTVGGNEKAGQYTAVIKRGIYAQLGLIRRLELDEQLDDPDELRLERGLVDLVELCRGLMERTDALTRPLLDIRAEFSSPLKMLPTVADEGALEEMLLAFLSNSVKAIGRGGTIRLELSQVENRAVLTLTDTGGGDAAGLCALFEQDPEEEEEPEKPSRGLLLAKKVAENHGGALMAGGGEQPGMCLAVSLPLVERAGGVMHSPGPAVDRGGWDPALVALAECLPLEAFMPKTK